MRGRRPREEETKGGGDRKLNVWRRLASLTFHVRWATGQWRGVVLWGAMSSKLSEIREKKMFVVICSTKEVCVCVWVGA